MVRNYLKIAFRCLIKQKPFSAINVLGLAISISARLLITLYVRYEHFYEASLPEADQVYKMALSAINKSCAG